MIKKFEGQYEYIISVENLLLYWRILESNKKYRKDVSLFKIHLMDNILDLHKSLKDGTYYHSKYEYFRINDPKPRDIHKATIRDRIVHRMMYMTLYSYFDSKFICDSYSCRVNKGTHKALLKFTQFSRKVSKNYKKQCWILKCDVKKFFASIDHALLKEVIGKYIVDKNILDLLEKVIDSFSSKEMGKGLPLGNLTSQLLANIYMNEFDQFIKHKLKVKYYIRYADDFVILDDDRNMMDDILLKVHQYLKEKLKLDLHPNKVSLRMLSSGVDFLGWVHFPKYRVLRTGTKQRMFRRLEQDLRKEVVNSYLGLLKWGNSFKLSKIIWNLKNK
jgi:RNA-directed DNA polymerase